MSSLHEITRQLTSGHKGILAADESTVSANKRLAAYGISGTEENRRMYRELFINAPGIGNYLSGIILFDETFWQADRTETSFLETLKREHVLIGIKVDEGKIPDPDSREETITIGLNDLADRLREYREHGAMFAKWRAVIQIGDGLPTHGNIEKEATLLAEYARVCQEEGFVPIVEPEVLHQGRHTIETAEAVTKETLRIVFAALIARGVDLEALVLKTSMVLPGSAREQAEPITVAEATIRTLKDAVPETVGGIVFLSGGQTPTEATANLNAIQSLGPFAWPLSFSYARALQEPSLETWAGELRNFDRARMEFLHRCRMNVAANEGVWNEKMEE